MEGDDRALVYAWKAGDRAAGGELVRRHLPSLHRFFINKVNSEAEVQDLIQRTLTACAEGIDGFRVEASFRSWMFAIARNTFGLWVRARRRTTLTDIDEISIADLGVGPNTALGAVREHRQLLQALRRIPLESQIILELYY